MSGVPLGLGIRVGKMTDKLPYPVNIRLPSTTTPEVRTSPKTIGPELDIVVPDCPERHTALGAFMDSWSQLEQHLHHILSMFLGVRIELAFPVAASMGMKQICDALNGLALVRLSKEDAQLFVNLIERVMKLNAKRNILVHGHWILEANVINRRGEAVLVTQFLRQVDPLDPEVRHAMANPRNQKERVRYSFNLKRIAATARDTDTIKKDLGRFVVEKGIRPVFLEPPEEQPARTPTPSAPSADANDVPSVRPSI